jgi:hypothetical protein
MIRSLRCGPLSAGLLLVASIGVASTLGPQTALGSTPGELTYASYFGGGGADRGLGVAVDPQGNAYVTGLVSTLYGGDDVYVAKFNPGGTALIYLLTFGGAGFDAGFDIAVDLAGNAYVTGGTSSPNFPTVGGPDLSYNGGGTDAFVAKVDPSGSQLLYSGFIGGSGSDFGEGIQVDSTGAAFITGATDSTEITFPVATGPDLTQNGGFDVFVAGLKAAPDSPIVEDNFLYSGFIGGSADDIGISGRNATSGHVAIDTSGAAYISGMTKSSEATFPDGDGFGAVPGPDRTQNGKYDAFVAKVSPDGARLVYAGYIGGRGDDFGFGMAVDRGGSAYLTGNTTSSEATFPVKVGPDVTYNQGIDTFVAKVNPAGTALEYAGYVGGKSLDQGLGVAIDGSGRLYVAGHTLSDENSFPVAVGPDLTFNGSRNKGDAFVVRVNSSGLSLDLAGYIGGTGQDAAFWIALDQQGDIYLVGDTESNELSFPDGDGFGSLSGLDQTQNGGPDAFIVKLEG